MILNQNCFDFVYIRRENFQKESLENLITFHNFAVYPSELKKKVVLIQHFKGYLDGAKFEPNLEKPYPESVLKEDKEGKMY